MPEQVRRPNPWRKMTMMIMMMMMMKKDLKGVWVGKCGGIYWV
jgi:hypothetical protein